MTTTNLHAAALRATYLHTFDTFATDPSTVATLPEVGNVRYARELLATLRTADLVVDAEVNGEDVVWQTTYTYDDHTRQFAEEVIDTFLASSDSAPSTPKKATVKTKAPAVTNPNLRACPCGCGLTANSKRTTYRPGHDARHASQVARAIIALPGGAHAEAKQLLASLPTAALQAKASAQVARGGAKIVKAKATAKASAKPAVVDGTVKVGRWSYPAQMFIGTEGKHLNINDARDGSGDWLDGEGYNGKPVSHWLAKFVANA